MDTLDKENAMSGKHPKERHDSHGMTTVESWLRSVKQFIT